MADFNISFEAMDDDMKIEFASYIAGRGADLPDVTPEDEGKVLTVGDTGEWEAKEPEKELPSVTEEDAGKVLTVSDSGSWEAKEAGEGGGGLTVELIGQTNKGTWFNLQSGVLQLDKPYTDYKILRFVSYTSTNEILQYDLLVDGILAEEEAQYSNNYAMLRWNQINGLRFSKTKNTISSTGSSGTLYWLKVYGIK